MTARASLVSGFALVEAMVTVVVVAFGLLGVAGLVSRSFVTEVESTQRTQAVMLLQDLVTRIEANRANGAGYVTGDTGVTGYTVDAGGAAVTVACNPAADVAQIDLCEWSRLLAGTNEVIDARNAGVLVGAIGCVYEIDAFNRVYAVAIAWQGMNPGVAPPADNTFAPHGCGRDRFGNANENLRRVMAVPVRLGILG